MSGSDNFTTNQKQLSNRILAQMDSEKRRRVRALIGQTEQPGSPVAEYLFDTAGAGTWTKPDFGSRIEIWGCGSGAGGGSGRKGANGALRAGGRAGGSGTPRLLGVFDRTPFPSSISFNIGAGGVGGAVQATNSTNGVAGSPGNNTTVTIAGTEITLPGGTGGVGGAATSYSENTNVNAVSVTLPFRSWVESPDTPGGSVSAANALVAPPLTFQSALIPVQPAGADAVRTAPGLLSKYVGALPRGGAASITGNAQKGGDGILGIGGAGGGASVDDVGNSGAGGRGGDGFVYIAVY